jgi:hypothetical protein
MNETPFKLEQLRVITINVRAGWQVEITQWQSYDAILVNFEEFPFKEDSVTEGKEAMPLPS